MFKIEVGKK